MQAFAAEPRPLRLADLSRITGMSHPLARHHLQQLLALGLVLKDTGKEGHYICQACFIHPLQSEVVFHAMNIIVAAIENGIVYPADMPDEERALMLAEAVRLSLQRFVIQY